MALSLAVLTPFDAEAGSKRWKKHRRHEAPRRVVVVHHPRPVVQIHRSCDTAPVRRPIVRYGDDRFYWSAAVGFYVDRGWVNVGIGNLPPRGSVYYDRPCGREFTSLRGYRKHLERSHHPEILEVRTVSYGDRHRDRCGDDHGDRDDYAEHYDDHDHGYED
jgi:hypothetical protein